MFYILNTLNTGSLGKNLARLYEKYTVLLAQRHRRKKDNLDWTSMDWPIIL